MLVSAVVYPLVNIPAIHVPISPAPKTATSCTSRNICHYFTGGYRIRLAKKRGERLLFSMNEHEVAWIVLVACWLNFAVS